MLITRETYQDILISQNEIPPETGGILGGVNEKIITAVKDNGIQSKRICSYTPDVQKMNQVIAKWQNNNIEFMGIFHSHFFGVATLSPEDKKYIERIMRNMPAFIERLFFPIVVMPQREMVSYKASLVGRQLTIEEDIITIC